MLTIKQITDDKEAVIRGLEKNILKVRAKPSKAYLPLTINAKPPRPNATDCFQKSTPSPKASVH